MQQIFRKTPMSKYDFDNVNMVDAVRKYAAYFEDNFK